MQVRSKSRPRARGRVSTPERPRAATGFQPDVSRTRPWPLPASQRAPRGSPRAPPPPITQAPPQSQAGFYGQQEQQQMAHNPYAMWPQVRVAREPRATRLARVVPLSPRQIRPRIAKRALTTSDPCPPIPSAGHDEPLRHRRSGHVPRLPGAFARRPSLPPARIPPLATAAPPPSRPRLTSAKYLISPSSGELRRRGFRHGCRRG